MRYIYTETIKDKMGFEQLLGSLSAKDLTTEPPGSLDATQFKKLPITFTFKEINSSTAEGRLFQML